MTPRRQANDGGFTVVEIMISSAILFFVATALFGLVATSTMLSVTAKADTIAVNAANTFLEQVRRLPYAQITQASINTLAARASEVTVDGVRVSVSATVTPQWLPEQNPATTAAPFQRVTVRVTAAGNIGRPFVFNTGTFVANLTHAASGATSTAGPIIGILSPPTPLSGVVRGSSVFLGMRATSGGSEVNLTTLRIVAGGDLQGEIFPNALESQLTTSWNTTLYADGSHSIQMTARDSLGQASVRQWSVIVDNHPPSAPGAPTIRSVTANTLVSHQWAGAMDGMDAVTEHQIVWNQQPLTASTFSPVGQPVVAPGTQFDASTVSFSRYRIDVRSLGPVVTSPMVRHASDPVSAIYISRPGFSGSPTLTVQARNNRAAQFGITLRGDPPNFQTQGAITYRWQYRESWSGAATNWIELGSGNPMTVTRTAGGNGPGWFEIRCIVTVTPSGGTAVSVPSVVARYTVTNNSTAAPRTDDWSAWTVTPVVTPAISWGIWPR